MEIIKAIGWLLLSFYFLVKMFAAMYAVFTLPDEFLMERYGVDKDHFRKSIGQFSIGILFIQILYFC